MSKPIKAWAIFGVKGLAPLKYVPIAHLAVEERVLPIWRTRRDAERWCGEHDYERVVRVEIREANDD